MSDLGSISTFLASAGAASQRLTGADIALLIFTGTNSVRVFAYLPQIRSVARDRHGAGAVSLITWTMFALSHLSTMIYALLVVADDKMALIFGANTLCCIVIVGLTAHKRAQGPARLTLMDEARLRARAA